LTQAIEKELGIHVQLFDPLSGVKLGNALVQSPPERPSRFAPLVGMLLAELKPSKHAIDFLHPRRRAPAADPRKKWIIAGAVAGVLFLGWMIYSRVEHYLLAGEVSELEQKSRGMTSEIEKAKKTRASTGDIGKWADEDVNWLDQLYVLEKSFPSAQEMMINDLKASSDSRGGQMTLKGWSAPNGIKRLQEAIFAHGGKMSETASSGADSAAPKPYTEHFDAVVLPEKTDKTPSPAPTEKPSSAKTEKPLSEKSEKS
jgi:hypothetical protein